MTTPDIEQQGGQVTGDEVARTGEVLRSVAVGALGAALAMLLFIRLAHEMMEGETQRFDVSVLALLAAHRSAWLFTLMGCVSQVAGPNIQSVLVCLAAAAFARRGRFWPDGLVLLTAGVGGAALVWGLKHLFHRPRPEVIFDRLGYSFPSGHSFFAVVVYGTLAYLLARMLPRRVRSWVWSTAGLAILLVGFSRIYLGEHYPSDVLAGFVVGVPWLWGCLALYQALARRKEVANTIG